MGKKSNLPIGVKKDLYVTIKNNQYKKLKAIILLNKNIEAPIYINQTIGFLNIKLNNKIIAKRPIISLENIEKNNKFFDTISYILKKKIFQYFNISI